MIRVPIDLNAEHESVSIESYAMAAQNLLDNEWRLTASKVEWKTQVMRAGVTVLSKDGAVPVDKSLA